jgi:hypothetical protein
VIVQTKSVHDDELADGVVAEAVDRHVPIIDDGVALVGVSGLGPPDPISLRR